MAARGASSTDGYHGTVLDDVFEDYGPINVDDFIDSQFKNALRGEEEMYSMNHGEPQLMGSKVEVNKMEADGCFPTLQNFAYGTDTQINLDRTISLTTPQAELESDIVCSFCRRVVKKDDLDDFRTFDAGNEVNTKTTTREKRNGCEIDGGIEVRGW